MSILKLLQGSRNRRKARPKTRPAREQTRSGPASRKFSRAAPEPWFWDRLSPERRLDVIGVLLAGVGLLILFTMLASSRSPLSGGLIRLLGRLVGWGVYVLPVGLIIFGAWLVLRRIERIPALSPERAVGSILLFAWFLTVIDTILPAPGIAQVSAGEVAGGGVIGGLVGRLLFVSFGPPGLVIALIIWALIALTMILDATLQDLLRWAGRQVTMLQTALRKAAHVPEATATLAQSNGYTPLQEAASAIPDASRMIAAVPGLQSGESQVITPAAIQWSLPEIRDVLDAGNAPAVNEEFIKQRAHLIEETLASFSAPAQVVEISRGPTITQFGVEPLFVETRGGRTRVRVSKIASLADDLALALAAPRIRIQAPVPGHSYVGIEVPNEEMALVALRDMLESETFQRNKPPLRFALGQDVAGHPIVADLASMPHLLIAGTTGSGKSVCVNSILTCFLLNNTPDDLRLVLVDPKRVELTSYNGIPHLLSPVVVETERVVGALQWMTREMDKRYHDFAKIGARNITDYNARMKLQGGRRLPFLLIVIDELADLMMIAPDETERGITRLAQLARATGIHMILATQRPSVDVVTGLIKANFPARIAFAVASGVDSRVILDQPGAERLLGRGDMLYQSPDAASPARLQGVFVSDPEIQKLVEFWKAQAAQSTPYAAPGTQVDALPDHIPLKQKPLWDDAEPNDGDPLIPEAIDLVRREGRASVSMLQRRMRIGYTRAARLVDVMEERGIVSPPEANSQVRQILDYGPTAPPPDEA